MADLHMKEGDTAPLAHYTLEDGAGDPISLAGASVRFVMRSLARGTTQPKVNGAAIVDDAVGGLVHYEWQPGDTDTPGGYKGEWVVTFAGGRIERHPNDRDFSVNIRRRLDKVS